MRARCAARSLLLLSFAQRPGYRGLEPLEIALEDIVDRAAAQRFDRALLADRPGDENEGHLRPFALRHGERGHPIKLGQREIREDDVVGSGPQSLEIGGFGLDPFECARHTVGSQAPNGELCVGFNVLDKQHSHQHACSPVALQSA